MKRSSSSGMALVVTMAFIVLIVILIVGLATAVQMDRPAANAYLERMRAGEFARMGVDSVVGDLRRYSSALSASGSGNWISRPGGLVVSSTGAAYSLQQSVPLHSGVATGASGDLAEPNLNIQTFRNLGDSLLTGSLASPPQMPVAWIYVRQDGTLDRTQPINTTDKANPIVGRFAYWADDESSKVNYNLAWTRSGTNTAPSGHPTRVELAALDGFSDTTGQALADAIHSATVSSGTYQFFNTPEDARRVDLAQSGVTDALTASKFDVTHFNHDPDTTFFNEPRIVLTTQPRLAGWTFNTNPAYPNQWVGVNGLPSSQWSIVNGKLSGGGRPVFLDIVEFGSNGEPISATGWNVWNPFETVDGKQVIGYEPPDTNLSKIARLIRVMNTYLRRTDWPMAPGSSFQARYYGGAPDRLTQLSLNIIDYVRSKECAGDPNANVVIPLRGDQTATGDTVKFKPSLATSASNSFLGIARIPKITELGTFVGSVLAGSGPSSFSYRWKLKIELYLPPHFGVPEIDVRNFFVGVQYFNENGSSRNNTFQIAAADLPGGDTKLKAGNYLTVTKDFATTADGFAIVLQNARSGAGVIPMRVVMYLGTYAGSTVGVPRVEVCPQVAGTKTEHYIPVPFDAASVPEANVSSLEVDDPRVNAHKDDWKPHVGAGNSFGQKNSVSTLGLVSGTYAPQQDTDGGVISDASLRMPPPPKANADTSLGENPGYVTSAGELGFIHTGMEISANPGTPWRTLRLQPNTQAVGEVPDWAFMDLFTAPVGAARDLDYPAKKYVYAPHDTAIGGRVNVNSKPEALNLDRIGPLAAALQGARSDTATLTQKLSPTQARTVAENIYKHNLATGGKSYGNTEIYDSPGEIVEIKGVADGGEKTEELFRQISNNITTRGNVFSVYGVGQSLKQLPSGKLNILAEQRVQTMVERFSENGQIHFAPLFFRLLTP
jgi:hypothetical protein